jgi:glycerate 2-kinase
MAEPVLVSRVAPGGQRRLTRASGMAPAAYRADPRQYGGIGLMDITPRLLLRWMFDAAVASARADACVPRYLPPVPPGRTLVIGAGKASAAMARAVEAHWPGGLEGLVVTRHGYRVPCRRVEVVEAAHPVPDAAGLRAARRVLDLVSGLTPDDLVLCLFSGGGSALLPLPLPGVALGQKQAIGRALLASGASIGEINCVRRHLSSIKGGRLAAACHPARVVNLLISDVPGDDPADIASGPTVGDPTTCADALSVADRYGIPLPPAVRAILAGGAGESVKPDDPRLAGVQTHLVATPQAALEAAAAVARAAGVPAHILSDRIEGEAREAGKVMAGIALQVARHRMPFAPPCVLISGGETTVTLSSQAGGRSAIPGDQSRGGRNVEFLLALAIALRGDPGVYAIAGDTDGVDGVEEIAGAVLTPDTLERARSMGLDPNAALARHDGHGFFGTLGDAVVTGPTLTNVNDFRAVLVGGAAAAGSLSQCPSPAGAIGDAADRLRQWPHVLKRLEEDAGAVAPPSPQILRQAISRRAGMDEEL